MIWDAVATCRVNRSLFAYLVHSVVHHFRKRSTSVPDRSVSSYSESALINLSFFLQNGVFWVPQRLYCS